MTENTVVRARINERIKNEASAVLASIGLTAFGCLPHDDDAHRQGKGAAVRTPGAE